MLKNVNAVVLKWSLLGLVCMVSGLGLTQLTRADQEDDSYPESSEVTIAPKNEIIPFRFKCHSDGKAEIDKKSFLKGRPIVNQAIIDKGNGICQAQLPGPETATALEEQRCAKSVGLGGFVRAGEETKKTGVCKSAKAGELCGMTLEEAKAHCEQSPGSRLPTARELATYSQCMGANGILPTEKLPAAEDFGGGKCFLAADGLSRTCYYEIPTLNTDQQEMVDFYYNYDGYRPLKGVLLNDFSWVNLIWSSAVAPHRLGFDVSKGQIFYADAYGHIGVRCVRSP